MIAHITKIVKHENTNICFVDISSPPQKKGSSANICFADICVQLGLNTAQTSDM